MRIDTSKWNERQQEQFIDGWVDAGGEVEDIDSPSPWCCPWYYDPVIDVSSNNPYRAGKEYWEQVKDEVKSYR